MLKYIKKIQIKRETFERVRVRRTTGTKQRLFCAGCGQERDFLTLEQAVFASGKSARELFRRVESGELHFHETTEGFLLFCNTLLNRQKENKGEIR